MLRPIRSFIRTGMLQTLVIIFVVLFDQITKYFAKLYLLDGPKVEMIPHVISLQYHENEGAAWGMLADHRWVFMSLSTIAILAIIAFLIWTRKQNNPLFLNLSLCFFAGGGIGNMIDRIFLGYVVDFLNFEFIDFPIFNIADSFISIGAVFIVIYLVLDFISDMKGKKNA